MCPDVFGCLESVEKYLKRLPRSKSHIIGNALVSLCAVISDGGRLMSRSECTLVPNLKPVHVNFDASDVAFLEGGEHVQHRVEAAPPEAQKAKRVQRVPRQQTSTCRV